MHAVSGCVNRFFCQCSSHYDCFSLCLSCCVSLSLTFSLSTVDVFCGLGDKGESKIICIRRVCEVRIRRFYCATFLAYIATVNVVETEGIVFASLLQKVVQYVVLFFVVCFCVVRSVCLVRERFFISTGNIVV